MTRYDFLPSPPLSYLLIPRTRSQKEKQKHQEPIHIQFADKAVEVDPIISLLSLAHVKSHHSSRAEKKFKSMPVLSCRSYHFSLFSLSHYCVQLDFLVKTPNITALFI